MPTVTTQDMEELETRGSDPAWDYLAGVDKSLAEGSFSVGTFRTALLDGDTRLRQRFIEQLILPIATRMRKLEHWSRSTMHGMPRL